MKGSVDKSTRDALADLYDQLEPQLEQMQSLADEYRKAGKAIPEALQQSIVEASAIGGLGGDSYALWGVIADSAKSEEYTKMIQQVEEAGGYVPQQVASAITDKQNEIDNAVKQSYLSTQETIDNIYGKNSFQIPINITPNVSNAPYSSSALKGVVKQGMRMAVFLTSRTLPGSQKTDRRRRSHWTARKMQSACGRKQASCWDWMDLTRRVIIPCL